MTCFNATTAAINAILKELASEIAKVSSPGSDWKSKLGVWHKAKFVWKSDFFSETMSGLRDQR